MLLSFEQLGLEPSLVQAVEQLGYSQPTPIQNEAIPVLLEGRNVLGQAQTGTGKTAAFALPLLQAIEPGAGHIQALVLTPTRELAIQVTEATLGLAKMTPVKVLAVYGGQSYEIQKRQLKRGVDVVVGTPGRMLDLIRQNVLDLSQVHYLVIDEADEMLDMGFIEDIEAILAQMPNDRQTALFSATLPDAVRKLADRYITDPHQISINPGRRTVDETDQSFIFVRDDDKTAALIRLLEVEEVKSALVFARTKARCQELADDLARRGYTAEALHGDLNQSRREYVLNRFRQNTINLLIATDVAARGLDIDTVSHVFNYDAPQDADDYVHRIGRTGRAGRDGIAITFFTPRERYRRANIESFTRQSIRERHVPSLGDIISRRDDQLTTKIEEQMILADHSRERDLIARMVQSGYDPLEIASAALKLARVGEPVLPNESIETIVFEPKRRKTESKNSSLNHNSISQINSDSGLVQQNKAIKIGKTNKETKQKSEYFTRLTDDGQKPYRKSYQGSKTMQGSGKGRVEAGMVRMVMNLGDSHGLRPKDVVGAIAGEVGIPGKAIGEITIYRDHSFVDVSEKHARRVLRESGGNYFLRGKPVVLRIAD